MISCGCKIHFIPIDSLDSAVFRSKRITSSMRCWTDSFLLMNTVMQYLSLTLRFASFIKYWPFPSFLKVVFFQDPACFGMPCCTSQYECWRRPEKNETPQEVKPSFNTVKYLAFSVLVLFSFISSLLKLHDGKWLQTYTTGPLWCETDTWSRGSSW